MQALISPEEQASYISAWVKTSVNPVTYNAVYTYIGQRISEIVPDGQTFEVASPQFWIACSNTVETWKDYYDPNSNSIVELPPIAPKPTE